MTVVVKGSTWLFFDTISICIGYLFQRTPNKQNQKTNDGNNWNNTGTEKVKNNLQNLSLVSYKLSDAVVCHNGCPAKALAYGNGLPTSI